MARRPWTLGGPAHHHLEDDRVAMLDGESGSVYRVFAHPRTEAAARIVGATRGDPRWPRIIGRPEMVRARVVIM
ncbi:MAG TPA: hypothetical protein VE198_22540 [Actinoallomurus sp.]|nr:hypothetical protein [Actinoallomurus sp.]